jgi:hypothetical protein
VTDIEYRLRGTLVGPTRDDSLAVWSVRDNWKGCKSRYRRCRCCFYPKNTSTTGALPLEAIYRKKASRN